MAIHGRPDLCDASARRCWHTLQLLRLLGSRIERRDHGPKPNLDERSQVVLFAMLAEEAAHVDVVVAGLESAQPNKCIDFVACDATVTGSRRKWHIWRVIGGNSTFADTAADALKRNSAYSSVAHCDALKIRRAPALGGSTPPPGTKAQTRVRCGFQRY